MLKSSLLLAAAAALLLVVELRGDETPATKPADSSADASALFGQLDANKDGQLSTDEIPAERKRLFERLLRNADKDRDGKLSAAEFAAGLDPKAAAEAEAKPKGDGNAPGGDKPEPGQLFKRWDKDGNGKLSAEELPERLRPLLARADADQDGSLNQEELAKALARAEKRRGGGKDDKRPQGPDAARMLFRRFDKNGDGKLTADEAPEERKKFVERLVSRGDKDGDKALSLDEFVAAFPGGRPDQGPPPGPPAAGANPPFPSLFGALDTDHDGQLSGSEISAAADVIRKLDADGDGKVTAREIFDGARPRASN